MDPALSKFDWPDFAPVAEALGGRGVTVRNTADLDAADRAIAQRDRPLLIDLKLDPDVVPWWL
jgi:thiamine pyrophosphate-dependent acetolactate synthase large subunit-like protein